jgi:hypothetical protein
MTLTPRLLRRPEIHRRDIETPTAELEPAA